MSYIIVEHRKSHDKSNKNVCQVLGLIRISLCKLCNRIHIFCSHLWMELNRRKTPNKWVNVLSMIHIELTSIM
jgi:hypothetical protein